MSNGTATYVYAVLKSEKKPTLRRAPKALPDADPVRLLDAGDAYYLVVSTVPLARFDGGAIDAHLRDLPWVGERASAHEAVVEHALTLGVVVPMKLFTIFKSDERAISHVTSARPTLERVVKRIADCDEWGVRVLFDEPAAVRAERERASKTRKEASGTSFLLRKKRQNEARQTLAARAADEAADLYADLDELAKRSSRRPAPNRELAGRVLLDAVFLVPRKRAKTFKAKVAGAGKRLADDGFAVALTGPWPAYSFVAPRD